MEERNLDENLKIRSQGSKFFAALQALKSRNTIRVLIQIIREIPKVKKNIKRIKKYGIKHILKYILQLENSRYPN